MQVGGTIIDAGLLLVARLDLSVNTIESQIIKQNYENNDVLQGGKIIFMIFK